ncbi:MAG TPA: hypothetical protein VGG48_16100 [Rhizomicrobium sp.]|jgi:hypothetical protein
MYTLRKSALSAGMAITASLLSGCAAITGMPDPVKVDPTTKDLSTVLVCPSSDQMTSYYGFSADSSGKAVAADVTKRNLVIAECIAAIDVNYRDFKRRLQADAVTANLTTDILSLTLSGGAALAKKETSKLLSEGATVVSGTGSAIDKDIFYEQTLPAIISIMEANRAAALKNIVDHESGDTTGKSYGLSEAVPDLNAYEAAGNIYKAISDLTKTANNTAQQAKDSLTDTQNAAYCAVVVSPTILPRLAAATAQVRKLQAPADQTKLNSIADAFSVSHPAGTAFEVERGAVITAIGQRVQGCAATQETAMSDVETKLAAFK